MKKHSNLRTLAGLIILGVFLAEIVAWILTSLLTYFSIEVWEDVPNGLIGLIVGVVAVGSLAHYLYKVNHELKVEVGAWQFAVVLDRFRGFLNLDDTKFVLREGDHLLMPWQTIVFRGSLKTRTLTSGDPSAEEEQKEKINTEGGAIFDCTWLQNWKPDASSDQALINFASKEDGVVIATLSRTMGAVITGILSEAQKTIVTMLRERVSMNGVIKTTYATDQATLAILQENGVIVELSKVSNLQLDDQSQKLFNQNLVRVNLKQFIDDLKGDIGAEKAANIFLLEDDVAQLFLVEIGGLENLSHFSFGMASGANAALAGALTGAGGRKNRGGGRTVRRGRARNRPRRSH